MSLDVYLIVKEPIKKVPTSGIFVRRNGRTEEISAADWYAENGLQEPVVFNQEETDTTTAYSANITHNLGKMAGEAGIYEHLWRPDEIGITVAKELIDPLRQGLHSLKSEPERYATFNPSNGWGDYDGLVLFVEDYLNACYQYPSATVEVSR